jgi:hypothetical protein
MILRLFRAIVLDGRQDEFKAAFLVRRSNRTAGMGRNAPFVSGDEPVIYVVVGGSEMTGVPFE